MIPESNRRRFATTRWSVVLAAGNVRSEDGRQALATLCETYWPPVYAFIRRSCQSADEARDLTQAFFLHLLEKNTVASANQERGRFRSLLLTSVRHFLANEHERAQALKRGGQYTHLPFDVADGERFCASEPVDNETPEHLYERRWALSVLDRALDILAEKFEGQRRQRLFATLRPFVFGDEPGSYAQLAEEAGMSEGALRVAVHRLRRQFGEALEELIAETVENPSDVADEVRYLTAILSR